jgi:hypothetical protein
MEEERLNTSAAENVATSTTKFVETESVVETDYKVVVEGDDFPVVLQGIRDFLEKPILIQTFSWTESAAFNSQITAITIGTELTGNAIWANKIAGFGLCRGVAVLRVQINANPFQQGRLIISFLPQVSNISPLDTSYLALHTTYMSSLTQLPNVELDCTETAAIIKIPYIGPTSWYNLKSSVYDWGSFFIKVLSPLNTGTGGENSINGSIFLHFEDFELAAPTIPQSSTSKKRFAIKRVGKSESDRLQEGPIASALSETSRVASSLGEIPMLAPVAEPLSWATNVASGVASAFGWSKAPLAKAPEIMVNQYNRYSAVSDGVDSSMPLALITDHKVAVTDGNSLRAEDEMSFAFLKKVSSYFATLTWSDTTAAGNSLYEMNGTPLSFFESSTFTHGAHTVTCTSGPPVMYLANKFNLWRGSLVLKIKIVKTAYHTGRLAISWTPGDTSYIDNTASVSNQVYAMRQVIDISEGNEFTLHLPYMLNSNYTTTNYTAAGTYGTSGYLDILVLNELRHPETAASSIQLLLYGSGGDDFEFQLPVTGAYGGVAISNRFPVVPQMGDKITEDNMAPFANKRLVPKFATESIGEMFTSVKQLLARYNLVNIITNPTATTSLGIWPWFNGVPYQGSSGMTGSTIGGDMYSYVSNMYLYYRGGMKIMLIPTQAAGSTAVQPGNMLMFGYNAPQQIVPGTTAPIFAPSTIIGDNTSATWWVPSLAVGSTSCNMGVAVQNVGVGYACFDVPYYAQTKVSLNIPMSSNVIPLDNSQAMSLLVVTCKNSAFADYSIFRSVSDDFCFSYFLGAPPLCVGLT